MKRKNPSFSHNDRVCRTVQFVEESGFESDIPIVCHTNKLKFRAAPSVFGFSSYKTGCTVWTEITVFYMKMLIQGKTKHNSHYELTESRKLSKHSDNETTDVVSC